MKVYNVHNVKEESLKVRFTFCPVIALQLYVFVFSSHKISMFFAKR